MESDSCWNRWSTDKMMIWRFSKRRFVFDKKKQQQHTFASKIYFVTRALWIMEYFHYSILTYGSWESTFRLPSNEWITFMKKKQLEGYWNRNININFHKFLNEWITWTFFQQFLSANAKLSENYFHGKTKSLQICWIYCMNQFDCTDCTWINSIAVALTLKHLKSEWDNHNNLFIHNSHKKNYFWFLFLIFNCTKMNE